MKTSSRSPVNRQAKRGTLLRGSRHDSYRPKRKPASPALWPVCKALYQEGRWLWAQVSGPATEQACPACQRMHDDFSAGYVTLKGDFLVAHRDEVMNRLHHHETREKGGHPLQRIMKVTDTTEGFVITTTDVHLARGLGDALHHAYHGTLNYHYNPQQAVIRVQ